MTDLETILSWFQTGDMPTEEEFRQTFSSFRHKNTKIPIEEVDRLESLLNSKINSDDYIKDGKIRADKIEALGLTELIEASEKDISEFAENSDKYEFQQNDFIAIPKEDGNFSLYLFKGGEKRNKSNYLSMGGMPNSTDTLQIVTDEGNTTTNPLILNGSYLEHNPSLKSYRFGGGIGANSIAMGYLALNANISGTNNTALGHFALNANTSGHRNTAIGIWAGELITTGWNNTLLGNSSASNLTTGRDNVVVGRTSGYSITTGYNNVVLGNNNGGSIGSIVNNNVIIGTIHGGGAQISNKLVIHNENLPAISSNPNGTPVTRAWDYALIYGDFQDKWLVLDSSLKVKRLQNAQDDETFTRQLVQKADGTLGYIERGSDGGVWSFSNNGGGIEL